MERYVLITGGEVYPTGLAKEAIERADKIYAVDSGAYTASELNLGIDGVFGDLDSINDKNPNLEQELRERGVKFIHVDTTLASMPKGQTGPLDRSQKDQSDTQMAIDWIITNGKRRKSDEILLTILGGVVGDRFDHTIANIFLLIHYAKVHPSVIIRVIIGNQEMWARSGPRRGPRKEIITGNKGDHVSLFAATGEVKGITTKGLFYPLTDESLIFGPTRGLSNKLIKKRASVSFQKGTLLFVHTHLAP